MVNMNTLRLFVVLGLGTFLFACGGTEADLEKARYLIGRGTLESANQAEAIVRPLLESSDLSTRMEAVRLFGGAKVAQAGVTGPRLISILANKEGSDTIKTLKRIFRTNLEGGQARARLEEAFVEFDKILSEAEVQALTPEDGRLFDRRQGLYLGYAMSKLVLALVIGLEETGLSAAESAGTAFTAALCEATASPETPDDFAQSWLDARTQAIRAGLDDVELKLVLNLAADAKNNPLNQFIQDVQAEVDADLNGEIDGPDEVEKRQLFCAYLETQAGE